jgi:GntR family transcriptional regulator/MocR family aminotransferase
VSLGSLHYGPPEGYGPLRQAIADYLRRARGVVCDAHQVIVVNGSQQAVDLTARVLLDAGDGVGIEEPHYQGARQVFLAAGARLLTVPVDAEGLKVAALPDAAWGTPGLAAVDQFPSGASCPWPRLGLWHEGARFHIVEDDYDSGSAMPTPRKAL